MPVRLFTRFAAATAALLLSLPGLAQSVDFDVLVDTDRRSATGCSVTPSDGAALNGFERRVRASVDLGSFDVIALEQSACTGTSFGAPAAVSGFATPYPLALNTGIGGADAVELAVGRSALGAANLSLLRVAFVADNGTGSDVLAATDGAGGGPIVLGLPVQIPALSIWGLGALVLVLLTLAWVAHRRMGRAGAVMAVMLVTTAAWAMTFALDGGLSDWGGRTPNATDPTGDATDGSAAIDLVAGFVVLDGDDLFFRMDVADTENQAPVAADDAFDTDEDTPLNIAAPGVLANDSDAELDPITAVLDTDVGNGTLTLNADGSFDYVPNVDFNGSDSFTYVTNDGQVDSAPATVTITINPINDPPVAVDDTATTDEDQQVDIDVLANDSDVDGDLDPATVTVTSGPANGTTSVNSTTGVITYTKSADFNGADSFVYEVCDDGTPLPAQCDTATVNITVNDVNDAPTFTAGPDQTVNEDAGAQTVAGWATAISPGAPNEIGQVLTFNFTGNTNPALFAAGPAVDPTTGDLTFTSATDANGSADLTLVLSDDGGTANGGVDTSAPQTFTITVSAVNDAPTFAASDPVAVDEDAGNQSVSGFATFDPGPANEAGQSVLGYTVSSVSNPGLFSSPPGVDNAGDLTYTPAAEANGTSTFDLVVQDDGGTPNGGTDTSAIQTFTITVNAVNDAPTFDNAGDVSSNEDAGAQTVAGWASNIGDGDGGTQTLTFDVTGNTNGALFSAAPAIDATTGDLTYTAAADANGSADITVVLSDDGGTANGGIDTSAPQTFTITVNAVNDAPTFAAGGDVGVLEDSGTYDQPWATNLDPGAADESGQVLTFNITANDNPGLFSAGPAIDAATGNLGFTPATDAFGVANLTVELMDDGGSANGGVDTSASVNLVITVTGINDAPSFTAGPDQAVDEDSGAQTINGWATGISAGPANEAGQVLTFNITGNTSPGLFSAGPSVSQTGDLSFTPAADAFGTATITLQLMDDGGTANGGVDTSSAQSFTITVNPVNDAPTVVDHTLTTHSAIRVTLGAADSERLKDGAVDVDDPPAALSVSPLPATSTNGALLTLVDPATGTYQYDPPGGFTGADSFTYEVCDSATTAPPAQCATGTVNVTVTGPALWVVDPSAAAGGDGSLNRPLQALSSLPGARATGGRIFLAAGNNAGGHAFVANERLIGQGATGNTFDGFHAVQVPANGTLDARPAMAGARPVVQGQVTLANGTLARGFNIAPASGIQGLLGNGAFTGIDVSQMNVATSNAPAVNLNGVTGNFTLDRVDANGGANGIVLVNTNTASGSFTVAGDGATAGSGGTIQNTTGNSVQLATASNVELNFMNITNSGGNGIFGSNVTGFTLDNSIVSNNGDEVNEGGLRFEENLLGTATISNSSISGSAEHNIEIINTSGVLSALNITGSTIGTNSALLGADGLLLETRNSAQANVVVSGSTFNDNQSDGIQISAINDSAASLTVNNNTFTSSLDASPAGSVGARGIVLSASTNADLTFDIGNTTSNLFENFSPNIGEEAINVTLVSTSTGASLTSGRINNNTFTNSGGAVGIDVRGDGALVMEIDGNTATVSRQAIDVITGEAVGDAATADLTITNNSLTVAGTAANPNNEAIGWLGDRDTVSCLNIRGNTGVASGTRDDIILDDFTDPAGSVQLESGAADCGGVCATSEAHLLANNTITDAISSATLVAPGTCATVP